MGTAKAITQSRSSGELSVFQQSVTLDPRPFTPAKALPLVSLNAPASTKTLYNRFDVQVVLIVTFVPRSDVVEVVNVVTGSVPDGFVASEYDIPGL
jgi:hypothetical protein